MTRLLPASWMTFTVNSRRVRQRRRLFATQRSRCSGQAENTPLLITGLPCSFTPAPDTLRMARFPLSFACRLLLLPSPTAHFSQCIAAHQLPVRPELAPRMANFAVNPASVAQLIVMIARPASLLQSPLG